MMWAALLRLAFAVLLHVFAVAAESSAECKSYYEKYLTELSRDPKPYNGENMVYFLHIPRTAGRTFHSCLLKPGTRASLRCPKAYDHLRIDLDVPRCNLLSSHDDYSVVNMLPDDVSVVSQIRDPLDRFLSAYEFAIEVASRQVNRKGVRPPRMEERVVTEDVWPWSYMIPFFLQDMNTRLEKLSAIPQDPEGRWLLVEEGGETFYHNKALGKSKWNLTAEEQDRLLPPLDPYNNPLVMSLEEFVDHPVAQELLHDGEMLQVLGLTNYSHWEAAADLRLCLVENRTLHEEMTSLADKRIRSFAHVGTTDTLMDSVASCAAALDMKLSEPAYAAGENRMANVEKITEGDDDTVLDDDEDNDKPGEKLQKAAVEARAKRAKLRQAQDLWNEALEGGAGEDVLDALRREANQARKEWRRAQANLVSARTEETNAKKQQEGSVDKTMPHSLGQQFQMCQHKAQSKNMDRKESSLKHLAMPDGRSIAFGKKARKMIPDRVLEKIRCKNSGDLHLYHLAQQLLAEKRQTQQAKGVLEELPSLESLSNLLHSPSPRKRRYFPRPEESRADEL